MEKTILQTTKNAQTIKIFSNLAHKYRELIASNFRSRMGDEDDTKPLEKQIVDKFKACPEKTRIHLSFLLLRIIAAPYQIHGEIDSSIRLSLRLQQLAFERLVELEKSVQ